MNKTKAYVLSNTHWDREWYMTHETYQIRLVKLWQRLLAILEQQDAYIFLTDGQYSMVEDYLLLFPAEKERVSRFVREGRLKVGPWFTQPLETLTCGEALIRNLHYGIRGAEELGGAMRFSYEIDEFGHASQMPQIYRGFGIEGAMAWRGLPAGSKSALRWEAPDGSAVTMLYSNRGYGEATDLPLCLDDYDETIDGRVIRRPGLRSRVANMLSLRQAVSETECMCWLNGIDHSFPQPDILDAIDTINKEYPNIEVRQTDPETYLTAITDAYAQKGLTMATVKGELMYTAESILESTHACHTRQKLLHARAERELTHMLEPTQVLASLADDSFDQSWTAERAWKLVLENHAHDTLGCTSVDGVFRESMSRYERALDISTQASEDGRRMVMASMNGEKSLTVFNTAAVPFDGVTTCMLDIPAGYGDEHFALADEDGNRIPLRILSVESITDIRYNPRCGHPTRTPAKQCKLLIDLSSASVPAFGWRRFRFLAGQAEFPTAPHTRVSRFLSTAPGVLENEHIRASINGNGTVDLTDKETGVTYPSQFLLEDTGEAGNAYLHIEPQGGKTQYSLGESVRVSLLYDTPLACAYEYKLTMDIPTGGKSTIEHTDPVYVTLVYTLTKNARSLSCALTIDNHATCHRLRVLFPTNLTEAQVSRSGQPFDFPERVIHMPEFTPGLAEQPFATHPMQELCDVSGADYGLTIAADGIYEYECTDDDARALALTVLRSTDTIGEGFEPFGRYRLREAENCCTITHNLTLFPHGSDWRQVYPTVQNALCGVTVTLNRTPEEAVLRDYKAPAVTLPDTGSAVTLEGDGLYVTCLKNAYAGDGIVVRILNIGDTEAAGKLRFTFPGRRLTGAWETDLDENMVNACAVAGDTVNFVLRKAGIVTYLLKSVVV